jgi:hypothetical protein
VTRYYSTPACRCLAPSQTFGTAHKAVEYARAAATLHHVAFVVWALGGPRLRKLAYCPAPSRPA